MGRRERPVDPADGPIAAFAVELRKLREEAGALPYRAMAARAHFAAATLAQAAAGERLPTLPVTLAYVAACGGDEREWRTRWAEAFAAGRDQAAEQSEAAKAPYRGLARFEAADRAYFFGRAALVERLSALVEAHRVVLVVGPSGSGKSSLVRAGLVPSLRPRAVRVMTPGADLRLHAAHEAELVVVDQFEEVFTLCEDPAERRAFIDALLAAGGVVLAVRADFFGHCADHPELIEAVRDSTLLVGPMGPAELREAIVKPAAAVGLIVQRELTARIIEEVAGQPGGLPLMSHALLETWKRHHGKALTLAEYEAIGGIEGAVARTSEELYADLTPARRDRLRHLLLRLVTPGETGAQDTRRPARYAELLTGDTDDPSPLLLERLAAARLITLDGDAVELAHEALLTAWPRLRSWAQEDRERLRVHRRLTEAADTWEDHDRDPGALYRGLRLEMVREHLSDQTLTPRERAFLAASDAERRKGRRRTAVLAVLVVLVLVAVSLIWQQRLVSDRQEREAYARRIIGAAESQRLSDPQLSMRLSLAAWRLADITETRAALRTASMQRQQDISASLDPVGARQDVDVVPSGSSYRVLVKSGLTLKVDSPRGRPTATRSADGRTMVVCAPGAPLQVWDLGTGHRLSTPWAPTLTAGQCGRLSPDGRVLLLPTNALIRVWDLPSGMEGATLNAPGVEEISFSADGAFVATAGGNELQVRATNHLQGVLARHPLGGQIDDLRIDPAAQEVRYLVGSTTVQTLHLGGIFTRDWREERATSAAFSPDGRNLAVVYRDRIELRDTRTGRTLQGPPRPSCPTPCWMIAAFSPDSRTLAYGDTRTASFTATVWDLAAQRTSGESPPVRNAGALAFTGDALTRWDLPGQQRTASALALSPDGEILAAGDEKGQTALWAGSMSRNLGTLPPTANSGGVSALAFSPDASILAVGTDEGVVQLWDAVARQPIGSPISTPGGAVLALALGGDALTVAGKHIPFQRYDLSTAGAAATICRRVGQGLSPDDWARYFPDFSYQSTCEQGQSNLPG